MNSVINKKLAFTIILAFATHAEAQKRSAPGQDLVDQYVDLAMRASPSELSKSGPWACEKAIPLGEPLRVHGANLKDAETRYILRCIQVECAKLDDKIQQGMNSLRSLPETELMELMRFAGFSQAEMDRVLASLGQKEIPTRSRVDCHNATALGRTYVFDSCVALPLSCGPI